MAELLNFEKLFNYINDRFETVKNSLISDGALTQPSIPLSKLSVLYGGGNLPTTDYTVDETNRTITITSSVLATDCRLYKIGGVEFLNYTVDGQVITVGGGTALTEFKTKLFNQAGNYLQGIQSNGNLLDNYTSYGVIEALPFELEDTRQVSYYQPFTLRMTSADKWRDNIMFLMQEFVADLHNKTAVIDGFSLRILLDVSPSYTQNYKGHGLEEFDSQVSFIAYITVAPDFAKDESLYIDNVLIPYTVFETGKTITTDTNTNKKSFFDYIAQRNDITIKITGLTYSNNAVLQALKKEVRNPLTLNETHIIRIQKGEVISGTIDGRTIELAETQAVDKLIVYNGINLMTIDTDYSITDNVITVLDDSITMTDIILLYGDYADIQGYIAVLIYGKITNNYEGNISYELNFSQKTELAEEADEE